MVTLERWTVVLTHPNGMMQLMVVMNIVTTMHLVSQHRHTYTQESRNISKISPMGGALP